MKPAYSFDALYRQLQLRKIPFFVTFFVVLVISYAFLYAIDFIPEPIEEAEKTLQTPSAAESAEVYETAQPPTEELGEPETEVIAKRNPVSIYFDTLDKEVRVLNPSSADLAVLDEALRSGAVRHPESADFTEDGNMFILAHSSYLPNVLNKNYQAFNDIQKLSWGDTIRVRSEDTEYIYRVQKVYEDKASELFVPHTPGEARLTLATCNVLGAKEDRYMVEAELVTQQSL